MVDSVDDLKSSRSIKVLNSRILNCWTRTAGREQIQDSCCAGRFQLSKPSRKPWRFTKLQFIDKVVDAEVNSDGVPYVQHKNKFPKRTVQKAEEESYSIFDWDS